MDATLVAQLFEQHDWVSAPVVDEDGKLLGLITLGDVVKARLSELAMEKEALEGMIMGH